MAFRFGLHDMWTRLNLFKRLRLAWLDRMRLQREVTAIGQTTDQFKKDGVA